MLKSSSLCLYSSILGTFWLKIEQFWPFEEISIFSNGGHLGWRAWLSDITFKGNPLRMIQAKFGLNWPSGLREDFWKSLQTDDGHQVMAIAHTGELKRGMETTGPIGTKLCLVFWWPSFKIVSGNPDIQPTWPLLLKTEKVDGILIVFLLNYWANHAFKLC